MTSIIRANTKGEITLTEAPRVNIPPVVLREPRQPLILGERRFKYFLGLTEHNSNRGFGNQTTDQVNTSFPVSLLIRMQELGLDPNYYYLRNGEWTIGSIPMSQILDSGSYFEFEGNVKNTAIASVGSNLPRADVVIYRDGRENLGNPYEIKQVVAPDHTTRKGPESGYSPELVIRPDTIAHLAASLVQNAGARRDEMREELTTLSSEVDWTDSLQVQRHFSSLRSLMLSVANIAEKGQKPFLYMPIWKYTDQAIPEEGFDAFFFSDAAFAKFMIDNSAEILTKPVVRRNERAVIWTYLLLRDALIHRKYDQAKIFAMPISEEKNDKAFAVNGKKSARHLSCHNLSHPRVGWNNLHNIVAPGATENKRIFTDIIGRMLGN